MSILFKNPALASYEANNPILLLVEGFEDSKDLFLEKVSGTLQPNFQLSYAIGNAAYINSFNERMGMYTIDGLYSTVNCDDSGSPSAIRTLPFFQFYLANNINTRQEPLRIVFSGTVIQGWIIKLNILGAKRTEQVEGLSYQLSFLGALAADPNGLLADSGDGEFGIGTSLSSGARDTPPGSVDTGYTAAQIDAYRAGVVGITSGGLSVPPQSPPPPGSASNPTIFI